MLKKKKSGNLNYRKATSLDTFLPGGKKRGKKDFQNLLF